MSKPGKVLRRLCKRLKVRLTVKRGKKRVYKSVKVLKRLCKRKKVKKKKKKVKIKRRRKFGVSSLQNLAAMEVSKHIRYAELERQGYPIDIRRRVQNVPLKKELEYFRLRTPQENAQIVRQILENGQNVIAPFINLRGANLAQLALGDAVLRGANLHNADLRGAHLYGVNLQGANLKGANLRRADLTDGNLQGANLKGANLVNAELGANLKGANFQGANLDYCWITGADLRETNLDNAFSLYKVRYNNQTRFPVGFDPTEIRELPNDRMKHMINMDDIPYERLR
jgi:hypothetical protein